MIDFDEGTQYSGTTAATSWTISTTDTTATTYYRLTPNSVVESIFVPFPEVKSDSQIALERMASFGIDPLKNLYRGLTAFGKLSALHFYHRARDRLDRWPSLKEKRKVWGISAA